jgi:DNA-binding NarL/FixJ family response regulator
MLEAKTLLLIDGNDKDRQYYAQRLKVTSPNCTIVEAASAEAGLDVFRSRPIDCVILELGLPDASGFEVLTRLVPVARHPEIPVVVLTQFTHEALLEVAKMNGAFGVLQKHTTSGDELAIAVHKALTTGQPADSSQSACDG